MQEETGEDSAYHLSKNKEDSQLVTNSILGEMGTEDLTLFNYFVGYSYIAQGIERSVIFVFFFLQAEGNVLRKRIKVL